MSGLQSELFPDLLHLRMRREVKREGRDTDISPLRLMEIRSRRPADGDAPSVDPEVPSAPGIPAFDEGIQVFPVPEPRHLHAPDPGSGEPRDIDIEEHPALEGVN